MEDELNMQIRHITDRIWLYGPGEWDGPLISRSCDEYERRTLALRLPGERALIVAYGKSGGGTEEGE